MPNIGVKKNLNAFHLKIIAILGMFINHMGTIFQWSHNIETLPFYTISEFVGRFTFPIMAYLLVEGYQYTRNVKKYAVRLVIFWLLSIYPFYLLHNPDYAFSMTDVPNNIFFTLLMGLFMMICYEKINSSVGKFFIVVLFMGLTILSDWPALGILMIWFLYKYHDERGIKKTMVIFFVIFEIISIIGIFAAKNSVAYYAEVIASFGSLVVGYLLTKYNGTRGYSPNWVKWGFYLFYPMHLVLLEFIKHFFF